MYCLVLKETSVTGKRSNRGNTINTRTQKGTGVKMRKNKFRKDLFMRISRCF